MSAAIFAYPQRASLAPGDDLVLNVRANGPRCEVAIARSGATLERAIVEPNALTTRADAWTSHAIALPPQARPGAYVARVVAPGEPGEPLLDARSNAAFFVLGARRRAPIIVNVPLFTYHAYAVGERDPDTDAAGASLYTGGESVSLLRPGGGIGGRYWDERNVDVYDRASPRQSWAHWDAKAVGWLERAGIEHDVCTDLDLHGDASLLDGRALLLCFGHHEYWTDAMRAHVERFVAGGGNVAFFGANSLWFRSAFDARTCELRRAGAWPRAESALTGVSYRCGGGWWRGPRPACGLTVRDASHWIFAGTGLRDGETFGADARLVGYECDGTAAASRGTVEIARAELAARWGEPRDDGEIFPAGRASFAVTTSAGTVVSVGTVDWPRVLERDPIVARITTTIVRRLGVRASDERG